MHWQRKPEAGPGVPYGARRIVSWFAWLPTAMSDGTTIVWLERYGVEQEFRPFTYTHKPVSYDTWTDVEKFLPRGQHE